MLAIGTAAEGKDGVADGEARVSGDDWVDAESCVSLVRTDVHVMWDDKETYIR
jgi:hypothetical protein